MTQTSNPPYPHKEEIALNGMVASIDARAADIGVEVLKKGGNAVDAVVTTAFLMVVYEPGSSGLGGHGGHMAFYNGRTGEVIGIDGSAKAPLRASPDMFREEIELPLPKHPGDVYRVKVRNEANEIGFRAVFAPSTVAQYAFLVENYGTMPWKEVLQPAILVAEEGFTADAVYVKSVNSTVESLRKRGDPVLLEPFLEAFQPGGVPLKVGDRVTQPLMGRTLRRLAEEGPNLFYHGEVADRIVQWVQQNGGILTREDFTSYQVETAPLNCVHYRGNEVLTYSNGANGSTVSEMLQILSNFDLRRMGYLTPAALHTIIETMKIGFADRFAYASDRDFVPVPYDGLSSRGYGRQRAGEIDPERAKEYDPGDPWPFQQSGSKVYRRWGWTPESVAQAASATSKEDTTFMTAVDRDRNMVLVTSSLKSLFGSQVVVPGLGFALNNSMHNGNALPGHVLSIEPGKHILRNSGPVIVARDGKPVMFASAPGARQIITSVLTTLVNTLDYGMGPQAALDAPRIHAEAYGREVSIEPSVPEATLERLRAMGHQVRVVPEWSLGARMLAIKVDLDSGLIWGGAEPRTHSGARGY